MRFAKTSVLAVAFTVIAAPAIAAPEVRPASAASSVDAGADVIVEPRAGANLQVRFRPNGCNDAACDVLAMVGNSGRAANATSTVTPVGGTTVQAVSERPLEAPLAVQSVLFAYWAYQDDSICSAVFGCEVWRMTLGSSGWCDTDGWCWGTRSRYGRVADINCGRGSAGYTISNEDCDFHGDPSKTDLYSSYQANVSGVVRGFPLNEDHFIHRHYQLARSWVAVG